MQGYPTSSYTIQKLRGYVNSWILSDKIRLRDVDQKIRVDTSGYIMAFRLARDLRDAERYVEELRILLDDILYTEKVGWHNHDTLVKELWSAMYFGEDYFEGEGVFDEFVYEQKEASPGIFTNRGKQFPNEYALRTSDGEATRD